MNSDNPKGFLAKVGSDLIDAGYDIIPIKRGEKYPLFKGWEQIRADHDLLDEWLEKGYGKCGVGILTANTPAVDIDVKDEELARYMEEWVHEHVGIAPVRLGNAPKRLLLFRAEEGSFTKINAMKYIDQDGLDHKVEILADGQQFVAYAIHPDTGKPYQWLYKDGPLVTPADELPVLTHEKAMAIRDEFERQCVERGWKPKTKARKESSSATDVVPRLRSGERDIFLEDSQKTDISDKELHEKLMLVPAQADYDGWLQIGMALYHQYDGGDEGLSLWHEWSEKAYPDEYDPDEIDSKWAKGKLKIDGKGRAPVTARIIIKLANEYVETELERIQVELTREIETAQTLGELRTVATKIKRQELDNAVRLMLAGALKERWKTVTRHNMSLGDIRKMVRYEAPQVKDTPHWLENWVYLTAEDKFYNHVTLEEMSVTGFNNAYSRYMLTKQELLEGNSHPETLPSNAALNLYQIETLVGRRYYPGEDEVFRMNGVKYVNTYTARNVPAVPDDDELTKRDKRNVEYVKAHFTHLFPDEREARIFMDYCAFIVQNPGKRPGWAVMLQGTEGDGKTFFGMMLGAVLGAENVRMLNAQNLQSEFNGWAESSQVVFIEEIRLHGHNRYDVLNRIKPLITNDVIDIRRMRTDPYNVPNMTSYLLATNYRDALPLTENDSRYFVLFSRFQTRQALNAFKKQNPDYYAHLYDALEESPGAIRKWLLEHEPSEHFSAGNRAPECKAKGYMAMLDKSEEQEAIELALDNSTRFDISRRLLSTSDLAEVLYDMNEMAEVPQTRKMNKILTDMGFTYLDRVFVNGRPRRYWSMEPEYFMVDGNVCTEKIRDWVNCDL